MWNLFFLCNTWIYLQSLSCSNRSNNSFNKWFCWKRLFLMYAFITQFPEVIINNSGQILKSFWSWECEVCNKGIDITSISYLSLRMFFFSFHVLFLLICIVETLPINNSDSIINYHRLFTYCWWSLSQQNEFE